MNAITRAVSRLVAKATPTLQSLGSTWHWPTVRESYAGAWQSNVTVDSAAVSSYWAVFACVTLIAKDISKLPAVVMQRDRAQGIFVPTNLRLVLRKPNHYQTWLEFAFTWIMSQLLNGNTYVLKERDPTTRFVVKMYVLDPGRVTPLVAPDGSVYYQLNADNLAGIETQITVPASEIIHDRMYTLYHPLIGVSPIYACGVGAMQGLSIQQNSAKFFQNMSRPSGMLTAPGAISNETAGRLKDAWEANYSAANIGRLAVLGDGLKYEAMTVNAVDAQLIEQLKMTGEMIAACYHVPGYKIGVGQMPTVANTAVLNQQYYDQCLQYLIEKMEKRLDEGLEVETPYETWLDLNALLRMDPAARYDAHTKAIAGGWMAPNEARREEDMVPVAGGDTPYLQQQNYSLAALDFRDKEAIKPVEEGGAADIQSSVMNGAQISGLQALIVAAAAGEIPAESARATIAAAFPLLSAAQIAAMIDPLATFEQTPDPAAPPPGAPAEDEPADEDEPEDEDEPADEDEPEDEPPPEDQAAAFLQHLVRAFDESLAA
jgi:HK97 family phage portal protein